MLLSLCRVAQRHSRNDQFHTSKTKHSRKPPPMILNHRLSLICKCRDVIFCPVQTFTQISDSLFFSFQLVLQHCYLYRHYLVSVLGALTLHIGGLMFMNTPCPWKYPSQFRGVDGPFPGSLVLCSAHSPIFEGTVQRCSTFSANFCSLSHAISHALYAPCTVCPARMYVTVWVSPRPLRPIQYLQSAARNVLLAACRVPVWLRLGLPGLSCSNP